MCRSHCSISMRRDDHENGWAKAAQNRSDRRQPSGRRRLTVRSPWRSASIHSRKNCHPHGCLGPAKAKQNFLSKLRSDRYPESQGANNAAGTARQSNDFEHSCPPAERPCPAPRTPTGLDLSTPLPPRQCRCGHRCRRGPVPAAATRPKRGIFFLPHWGCFGGGVDPGEAMLQALAQELA